MQKDLYSLFRHSSYKKEEAKEFLEKAEEKKLTPLFT